MTKIIKYDDKYIKELIYEAEKTNLPDLVQISERDEYMRVIELGDMVIPYLLERKSAIWDIALSKITGDGLNRSEYNSAERTQYWIKWVNENKQYKI